MTRGCRQLGRPCCSASQRDRIGRCTYAQTTTATETKHRTKCRCSDGKYYTTDVRKQHRGRFYGELHAPDQVLRCEGPPRGKEDTEVSKTIGIRCTHGETNSCTRSYAAARKDYCALESGQQAAGRPGSARFATEGCTCSANTRGKAGQKRGLALGHITTEQPATDPADSPVCIGSASDFGFVFSPKENQGKTERKLQVHKIQFR